MSCWRSQRVLMSAPEMTKECANHSLSCKLSKPDVSSLRYDCSNWMTNYWFIFLRPSPNILRLVGLCVYQGTVGTPRRSKRVVILVPQVSHWLNAISRLDLAFGSECLFAKFQH